MCPGFHLLCSVDSHVYPHVVDVGRLLVSQSTQINEFQVQQEKSVLRSKVENDVGRHCMPTQGTCLHLQGHMYLYTQTFVCTPPQMDLFLTLFLCMVSGKYPILYLCLLLVSVMSCRPNVPPIPYFRASKYKFGDLKSPRNSRMNHKAEVPKGTQLLRGGGRPERKPTLSTHENPSSLMLQLHLLASPVPSHHLHLLWVLASCQRSGKKHRPG